MIIYRLLIVRHVKTFIRGAFRLVARPAVRTPCTTSTTVAALVLLVSHAQGTNFSFIADGGLFGDPDNWMQSGPIDADGVPDDNDMIDFDRGAVPDYTVSFRTSFPVSPIRPTIDRLQVGTNALTFSGITLSGTSSSLTVDNTNSSETGRGVVIGFDTGDAAVLTSFLPGGLNTPYATLGSVDTSSGTLNVTGNSTFNVTGTGAAIELIVGRDGMGAINVTGGGDVNVAELTNLGVNETGVGNVSVSGADSTWTSSGAVGVGLRGTGILSIASEGVLTSAGAAIAHSTDSTGTATIDGNNSRWTVTGQFTVGFFGNGTLQITDGGRVEMNGAAGTTSDLGWFTTGVGNVSVSGANSTWTNSGPVVVGVQGMGTLNIASEGVVTSAGAAIGSVNLSTGTVTVDGNNSRWTVTGDFTVGNSGSGTLQITGGGRVEMNGAAGTVSYIGRLSTGEGDVTVSSGGSWGNMQILYIGEGGTGTLNVNAGGYVENLRGVLGNLSASQGTATVSGAVAQWVNTGDKLIVGNAGQGILNITNGGRVFNNAGSVGDQLGSIGTATVSGTDSWWSNSGDLTIAKFSQESQQLRTEMRIEAGGRVESANGLIAEEPDSSGIATVTGKDEHGNRSRWNNSGLLTVGKKGKGTLLIENGGSVSDLSGSIGAEEGSVGDVTVTGGGSTWANVSNFGGISIGGGGTGTLDILDGGSVSDYAGTIRKGTVTVAGTDLNGNPSKWTNSQLSINAAKENEAKLIIAGGGSVSAGFSNIGTDAGSYGAAVVTGVGSSWTNVQFFRVGDSGAGTLDVLNGGSVSSEGQGSVGEFGKGTMTIRDGGTVSSQEGLIGQKAGSEGTVDISGAGSIWTNSQNLHVGFEGIGKLTVANGGVAQAPLISINSQSSVHGGGTLLGDVTSEGLVSPGLSAGTLTIDGDYEQAVNGELLIELASVSNFDQLNVTGTTTLAGTLDVALLDGFAISGNQFLTILTAANVMGQFDTKLLPSVPDVTFDVIYNPTSVVLHVVAPDLSGDFDSDGDVDGADFVAWQTNFPKPTGATLAQGDADADGDVDGADFVVWQTNFPFTPAPAASPVAEPQTLLLALAALASYVALSRRPWGNRFLLCFG